MLKDSQGWNLTRFHLLPQGRAAARDHLELRSLLDRYNALGDVALGQEQACWLIILKSPNEDARHSARRRRVQARYNMRPGWSFYSDSDRLSYEVQAAQVTWRAGHFNRLLLHIYQRRLWDIMWMNAATGAIFAPYEAGVEVSKPTPQGLMGVISAHYGWLPQDGQGFVNFNPAQMQGTSFRVTKPCSEAISRAITKPDT